MTVENLEDRIREFINSGRRQATLLKNLTTWNKLCSSLDIVGDTQLAIRSHSQLQDIKDEGASYLIIYGTLQAMLLQQDAVKHIGDALDIKVKRPKELENIRVIRNSSVGHPAHQTENNLSKSSFIVRTSISPNGFQLMIVYSGDREYEFQNISIPKLIKTQEQYIIEVLLKVINELERQEVEHRKKHRENKLVDSFPSTTNYHISKIFESTSNPNEFPLGSANIKMIESFLDNFKQELNKRSEWGIYDSINYHYELIEYPLKRLAAYFACSDNMNERDAYIFTSFIADQVKKLEQIAQELDDEYNSTP